MIMILMMPLQDPNMFFGFVLFLFFFCFVLRQYFFSNNINIIWFGNHLSLVCFVLFWILLWPFQWVLCKRWKDVGGISVYWNQQTILKFKICTIYGVVTVFIKLYFFLVPGVQKKKVDCSRIASKKTFWWLYITIFFWYCWYDFSAQYLKPNLNYTLDKTHKSNLALRSHMTCIHNEMHKNTHGIVNYT